MFIIPALTSDILALSFDGKSSPSIKFNLPDQNTKIISSHSHGWGFGWYPHDHLSAMVMKDPAARGEQILVDAITDWSNFRSTAFFCKVRGASKGYSYKETQPFCRSFAGRDWLFMHNGDLEKAKLEALHGTHSRLLEPLGTTDSELAFCNLLTQIQAGEARKISEIDPKELHSWFLRYDPLGSSDMYFSDGDSIVCFQGTRSPKNLFFTRIQPPKNQDTYTSEAAQIHFPDPRDTYRTAFIVSSSPFTQGDWTQMRAGQLIIIRRGALVWSSSSQLSKSTLKKNPTLNATNTPLTTTLNPPVFMGPLQPEQPIMNTQNITPPQTNNQTFIENAASTPNMANANANVLNTRAITQTIDGHSLRYRLFEVIHNTYYEYSEPVQHSTHVYRLQPTDDINQEVVTSKLTISSPAEKIQFEDVFGNQAMHCIIDEPYTKLSVQAISHVKIFAAAPDDHSLSRRQTSIPLVWMPWQRQMMMPYLLPLELPETQLTELIEYAMSFVERNDFHLLKTIEDINASIYQDYQYVSGSTSLHTTPFEVYTSRQGVCQDFANLFICLARLLSIPARYRMGYIYTGANYANKIQSDASHAWAEVYLPYVGWRGFDPTNGCSVFQDHIRVACGRNYRDATPTSGTIYKGGGTETLTVDVKMRELF